MLQRIILRQQLLMLQFMQAERAREQVEADFYMRCTLAACKRQGLESVVGRLADTAARTCLSPSPDKRRNEEEAFVSLGGMYRSSSPSLQSLSNAAKRLRF